MRGIVLASLLLAPTALAQVAINQTILGELAQAFQAAGLTQLATLAASIVNTTGGAQLLGAITNSTKNITIFAPDDTALGKVPKNTTSDQIATILSYHVVHAGFANASFFSNAPNDTTLQTFLNDTNTVQLQGNASQVLIANNKTGQINILNQNPTVQVTNHTAFANFDVLIINGVLTPPGSLTAALKNNGLTQLATIAGAANLTGPLEAAHGITIFAPTDAALTAAISKLGPSVASNTSLLEAIISNHIINGTAIYSSEFTQQYTSAGGESLSFNQTNGTNIAVSSGSSGNFTANVVTRDILTSNGVIHIIDNVLANPDTNPSAASSAFSSATSAASNPTTATGPIGTTPAGSPSNGAAPALRAPLTVALGAVVAVALGACLL